MILSFSRRLAFIAIPKTATHAVRRCLRPLLAANDWEQCTLDEQLFFPVAELAAAGHGHLTWQEVQPFLLPGMWDSFTSFAVVRDPYDRFASFARFAFRSDKGLPDDLEARLKRLLADPQRSGHILLRPQNQFVCDEEGRIRVSRILRHETLADGLAGLGRDLGLAITAPVRVNQSPPARPLGWDAELAGMVREKYAADFALFGYDPAASPP